MQLPKSWSPVEKRESARFNLYNAILEIKSFQECEEFFAEFCTPNEIRLLNERVTAGLEFADNVLPQEVMSDPFEAAKMMINWHHGNIGFRRIILRLQKSIQQQKEAMEMFAKR